jgi:hypothetical protein
MHRVARRRHRDSDGPIELDGTKGTEQRGTATLRRGGREDAPPFEARNSMPSRKHRSLVTLLTESPELLVDLVRRCFGFHVPDGLELVPGPETVRVLASERIADGAIVARRHGGGLREAFVVEVQLRLDRAKRKAWASYVVGTWARLGCPTTLVVVTLSERVARWAAEPVDIGRGRLVLKPLVVGPSQIPADMSLEDARAWPEKLALSVITHGHKGGSLSLGRTALKIAQELVASGEHGSIVLADLISASVNAGVKRIVEAEMIVDGREYFSNIGRSYVKQAKAMAKALGAVIEARALQPTAEQRVLIDRCHDHQQLDRWIRRAALADDMTEVFAS